MRSSVLGFFSDLAADSSAELGELRAPTFLLHSSAAPVLLLAATALAVFKPRGLTT